MEFVPRLFKIPWHSVTIWRLGIRYEFGAPDKKFADRGIVITPAESCDDFLDVLNAAIVDEACAAETLSAEGL